MITLGIETSCDETAIGVIQDGKVLANIVSSQIVHSKYGGVVPELAARGHIKVIIPLLKIALESAQIKLEDIDLLTATYGPGLIGALLVGLSFTKSLSIALNRPFVGVNHLEGHLYALNLQKKDIQYPRLVLLVSGGHTEVVLINQEFNYVTLSRTVDDACGEAFDKVAKLLGLPYPGGPYIEKIALKGRAGSVKFPVPRPKNFNFSYAGLKTAVLYYLRDHPDARVEDVAVNFQEAALSHLYEVVDHFIRKTDVKHLGVVGGVSANQMLRKKFKNLSVHRQIELHIPELQHCTDNGVMIALAGAARFKKFGPSELSCDAVARQALDCISAPLS